MSEITKPKKPARERVLVPEEWTQMYEQFPYNYKTELRDKFNDMFQYSSHSRFYRLVTARDVNPTPGEYTWLEKTIQGYYDFLTDSNKDIINPELSEA